MSEQITKDLGGITAYAAAVAAGYTGTKSQFETLMASYATVAQNAAASAQAANGSAENAEAYAVGTRDGSDVGSTDPAYHNNSKYYAELAEDYAESIDPDTLAKIDGYYDTLGAGTAEQLTSNIYEEDNTPYNFRTSGGSIDIGDRETDMVVGGTVAWNQLAISTGYSTETINGITFTKNDDGTWTINGTATANAIKGIGYTAPNMVSGHKYICGSSAWASAQYGVAANGYYAQRDAQYWMWNIPINLVAYVTEGTTVNNVVLKPQLFDLTQMFGSTIADYIYSLEQANAGAGVAWFKKLFPKPYYAYNAGELMSVNTSAHNTVGFNQWDEEWEVGGIGNIAGANQPNTIQIRSKNYIPVIPNATYYFRCDSAMNSYNVQARFYDKDKNYLGAVSTLWYCNNTYTIPSEAHYFRFCMQNQYGTTYNNDICINLSWDGERDGEYEAYVKHSYPLDSSLTLRGIPKLDASNNLYYDGDTYESDGTVTRKYGIVDLGTLTWNRESEGVFYATATSLGMNAITNTGLKSSLVCSNYIAASVNSIQQNKTGVGAYHYSGNNNDYIYIGNSAFDTAANAKTGLNGVYLVYELATPTTETADPYTNPQIVNDFGTEEYVDYPYSQGDRDVSIPVGHETQYMANLKAKLEMSPNSPEGAGDYIVRQTNGENEYVTLASNATIQDIIARLEALEGNTEGGGE